MDKITRVQEVSSFIKNFDSNYWNEVVLRLTIIGIRYIRNKYHNYDKWKIEDLSLVLDHLKYSKNLSNNFKALHGNKMNNIIKRNDNTNNNAFNKYNYNYSNNSFLNKKSKDIKLSMNKSNIKSNFKSKSIINKKKYNDTSSNDTSLLLTDREAHKYNKAKNMKSVGKIKEDKLNKDIKSLNKYIKQNKYNDENNFKGLCCGNTRRNTNRNKLLSLNNQYGDSELNIIVSDFPFSNKSLILNDNKENQNLS